MSNVRLSKIAAGSLDVNLSDVDETAGGGHRMSVERWQLAMQYAILQELKRLNVTLNYYRVRRMSDNVNRIDKRLARAGMLAIKPRKVRK